MFPPTKILVSAFSKQTPATGWPWAPVQHWERPWDGAPNLCGGQSSGNLPGKHLPACGHLGLSPPCSPWSPQPPGESGFQLIAGIPANCRNSRGKPQSPPVHGTTQGWVQPSHPQNLPWWGWKSLCTPRDSSPCPIHPHSPKASSKMPWMQFPTAGVRQGEATRAGTFSWEEKSHREVVTGS